MFSNEKHPMTQFAVAILLSNKSHGCASNPQIVKRFSDCFMLSVSFIFYLITKVSHGRTLLCLSSMNKCVMNYSCFTIVPHLLYPTTGINKLLFYMSVFESIIMSYSYVTISHHLIYMHRAASCFSSCFCY